jgi:hypothetical protein
MPNHTSLYANTQITSLLVPAVRNTDVASTHLDLQNCDDAVLVVHLGDSADSLSGSNYIEVEIQESDTTTDGDFTAVANADLTNYSSEATTNVGTIAKIDAAAEDQVAVFCGYKGSKRYIRAKLNFTGTHSTGTPCSVVGLRGRNRQAPVNAYS